MKKLLLGVIAFALIITSCNKYEDDFKDLNAKIDALKVQVAGVATLSAGITSMQTQLTALSAYVATMPKTADIVAVGTSVTALTTKVNTVQTALDKLAVDVAAGKVKLDAAASVVAQLQTSLTAAQADIVKILDNTSHYVGDVSITSDAEVDFWTPKIAQLGMISGTFTVTTSGISLTKVAAMNVILKNVNAVIGGTIITAASGKDIDLSHLTSVVGDFTATGGNLIPQSTMDISSLASVTGNLSLSFDGPYASTALTTVGGNLALTNYTTTGTTITGTTSVNFPLVSVTGTINGGTPNWPLATTVNVAGNMTTFDATIATTVALRGNYAAGLVFNAPLATSVSIGAATAAGPITINAAVATSVSLPNLTSVGAGNAIGITTSAVTAVSLPLLTTSGAIAINMGTANNGSVDLSVFASAVDVGITGPKTVTLPKYVSGGLSAPQATTLTLAKYEANTITALAVETLTLGALNTAAFNITTTFPALKVASITAKSTSTVASVTSAANSTVTGLTLAGPMVSAVVDGQAKLTSLATSGVINSLTVNSCALLNTGLSLAHTHLVGGIGSILVVTNNPILASLTTSTNFMSTLTVTGNTVLAAMNFNSYVDILYPGSSVSITIKNNDINGSYTAPKTQTETTAFVEAIVKSNDLLTLKAYVAKMAVTAVNVTQTLDIDVDDIDAVTADNQKLSTTMTDTAIDVTRPTVVDATGGINKATEMALVVAL